MEYIDHWRSKITDGQIGEARVESFTVSKTEAQISSLRGSFILPGTYKRLYVAGELMMSDTDQEFRDHQMFFRQAKGKVLINGLGLGCCLNVVLHKPGVDHVTVIERSADVITLIAPYFPQATIIHADALTWKPQPDDRFDAVWHDIWPDISTKNLSDMHTLHRRYGRRSGWQGSWSRATLEYMRRRKKHNLGYSGLLSCT